MFIIKNQQDVYETLKSGNFQALVIKDLAPFKKGESVDISLGEQGSVLATNELFVDYAKDIKERVYNLAAKDDYNKYFSIY